MYYLSFPGLGIEPFHIEKIAFTVFGRSVAWYGILITFGMILAVLWATHLGKFEGISVDDITDLAFTVIICGVIGARLYYVLFSWNDYHYLVTDAVSDGTFSGALAAFGSNLWHTFVNCIAIWNGGLAIYGGILAGLLSAYIFSRVKKIRFLKLFDILVPCVLIGQVIGRWGNFINIEAYGSETTLPWRMGILYSYAGTGLETGLWDLEKYVHPTFLYESLWNLVGLILVLFLYKKKKFDGQMFGSYLMWYGFGRMLIEGLRTDSLMLGNLRISQGVGFVSVLLGIFLMVFLSGKMKKTAEKEYVPVYDKLTSEKTVSADAKEEADAVSEDGESRSNHPDEKEK